MSEVDNYLKRLEDLAAAKTAAAADAAGKKRGANPPDAVYNGLKIIYSAELRTNPTPENTKRLTALISEFQSRHRLKTAIGEKAKTIHCRSAESLYQAQTKHGA